jgi:hypothetical protein
MESVDGAEKRAILERVVGDLKRLKDDAASVGEDFLALLIGNALDEAMVRMAMLA